MWRLAIFFDQIISPKFVKGRLIIENVSLEHELMQEIDRKSCIKNIIFKLDMEKDFDWVEWPFCSE